MLNYNSEHPFIHKNGVIFNLFDREILLSHSTFCKENIKKVKNLLKLNDYPNNIIKRFVNDRMHYCLQRISDNSKTSARINSNCKRMIKQILFIEIVVDLVTLHTFVRVSVKLESELVNIDEIAKNDIKILLFSKIFSILIILSILMELIFLA